jgi:hypothetical protein
MFQLTTDKKQEVVTHCDHLHKLKLSRPFPYAFTEHGAIHAANVLSSAQAIKVGIYIVHAFVRLRELLLLNTKPAQRLEELEERTERKLNTHDQAVTGLMNTLRQMMTPPETKKRPIGFIHPKDED